MKKLPRLICAGLLAVLAACASPIVPGGAMQRDNLLTEYGVAIRWNEFEDAQRYVDPQVSQLHPLSDLERERFKQIQVTGYDVKNRSIGVDGGVEQTVEIRLISRNTQIERSITDHQSWRLDPIAKRLWLTSGLPDFNEK